MLDNKTGGSWGLGGGRREGEKGRSTVARVLAEYQSAGGEQLQPELLALFVFLFFFFLLLFIYLLISFLFFLLFFIKLSLSQPVNFYTFQFYSPAHCRGGGRSRSERTNAI